MCYNNAVVYFSTKPTELILKRLNSPDKKLKIIHIAGTNGKGSTAEYFTNILIAAKFKTGTFTSPAVYSYTDQFRINGAPLTKAQFEKYIRQAEAAAEGTGASQFETETAGCILAFAKEGCEWAVIECGMGGLNDATNAISRKELAVITSVSLEHTQYLGGTVAEICAQKAGIIKNCPAVVNSYQSPEAVEYFKNTGAVFADRALCAGFEINAAGNLQPYNAATAIAGARILGIDERAIHEGIKNTRPRGRLEVINRAGREYVLDGAHNPAAFGPLKNFLSAFEKESVSLIFGCLSDKDIDGILKILKSCAEKIIAVKCPSPRAISLVLTKEKCRKYFNDVSSAESVAQALSSATTHTVAVCGSFTLLKQAKDWIEQ